MPHPRRLAATALAIVVAALAPLASSAAASPAHVPHVNVKLVRQLSKLDGQYHSLRNRVKTCPSARTDLRIAGRQRVLAMTGSSVHRSTANLRLRRARLAAAVVRLARAARSCAVSGTVTATATALPGPAPGTGLLTLSDLLGGVTLDVGPLTNGAPLGNLTLVDLSQLASPACTAAGTSCVGIDASKLLAAADRLIAPNLLAGLLNLDLPATLADLQALLGAGDLGSLVRVERVSDTLVRLVPLGPLAALSALPGIPATPVGLLDVLG